MYEEVQRVTFLQSISVVLTNLLQVLSLFFSPPNGIWDLHSDAIQQKTCALCEDYYKGALWIQFKEILWQVSNILLPFMHVNKATFKYVVVQ